MTSHIEQESRSVTSRASSTKEQQATQFVQSVFISESLETWHGVTNKASATRCCSRGLKTPACTCPIHEASGRCEDQESLAAPMLSFSCRSALCPPADWRFASQPISTVQLLDNPPACQWSSITAFNWSSWPEACRFGG